MIAALTGGQIIKYMGLPRFRVRLENLFMTGFQFVMLVGIVLIFIQIMLLAVGMFTHPLTDSS